MTPMGRFQLLILFVLLGAASSCSSTSSPGLYPAPVWLPEIQDVKVPSGSFIDGDTAEFEVEWTGGRSPFKVFWDFGGGGAPDEIESDVNVQLHAISTRFVNESSAGKTYTGTVRVVDWTNNQTSHDFTFTVGPAPAPEAPADEGDGAGDGGEPPVDDGGEPPADDSTPPDDGTGTPPDDGTEVPPDDGGETPPDDGEDPPPVEDDPPVEEEPPVDDEPPVEVDPPPPPL